MTGAAGSVARWKIWSAAGIGLLAVLAVYAVGCSKAPEPPRQAPGAVTGAAGSAAGAHVPSPGAGGEAGAGPDASLPAPGTSLKDAFAGLQARAKAGDADAASRLVRGIVRCRVAQGSRRRQAEATGGLAAKPTEGMSEAQLRTHQMQLDAMEIRQRSSQADQDFCAGASDAMLDSVVESVALAARLGDPDARACYLGSGPMYDARALLAHPESLRTYRDDATAMIRAGLAAGDWRIVDLLQQAYAPGATGMLAAVVGDDPALYYRFAKLYRLGAEPHRAAALDRGLAAAAMGLDSAQIADGDAWAERTFRTDFNGTSTASTPPGWDPCAF